MYARNKGSGKTVVCTCSFEPSLLADAISTKISCADPYALRPNKKISVFRVTGLKILGRAGTHTFLIYFFSIILRILKGKGISPFKMQKIIFFPENLKKL